MTILKEIQLLGVRSKLGLVAGFISFISGIIGIYSFFDFKEQDPQVTKQLQEIAESFKDIDQNMKELKISTMLLRQSVVRLQSVIDTNTDKAKVALEVQKSRSALTSSLTLAQEIEQSINATKKQAHNIESKVTKNQRELLEEHLRRLQTEKESLEMQYKRSKEVGERMRKIQEEALKRLEINV